MDDDPDAIKKFCENFFKNLNANIKYENKVLSIESPPQDFEQFYGKKGPYYLVFDRSMAEKIPNSELMSKGSYLLKIMTSYLEDRGQTALLRLNFNVETNDIKSCLKLKNCQISKLAKNEKNEFLVRFTFMTIFQYLNNKEQIITDIFVNKEGFIDLDISNFNLSEGKKNEIVIGDIRPMYDAAKIEIKKIIQPKVDDIKISLKNRMQKDIERIRNHYDLQINEIEEKIAGCEKQIEELESGKTAGDFKNIPFRLNKLREQIEELKKNSNRDALVKERDFFINDEIHKYSLSINNKIINATIIYYPIFSFNVFLKNNEAAREIYLSYHPVNKNITKIFCDSCKREILELNLCSFGHISCSECISRCGDCGKEFCRECLIKTCGICGRRICKKCIKKCLRCGNYCCSNHARREPSGDLCISCLKRCPSCGQSVDSLKRCPSCGREMCENCARRELVQSNGTACTSCTKRCLSCGKYFEKKSFDRCKICNIRNCNYSGKCLNCRRQLCVKLK